LIKGRKRPIVVDTIGYLIVALVHAANIYDGHAARQVLTALFSIVDSVKKIWADGGYRGEEFIQWSKSNLTAYWKSLRRKNRRRFSSVTSTLGRGTNLCLARSIPTVEQRLRAETYIEYRSCLYGLNPTHAAKNL